MSNIHTLFGSSSRSQTITQPASENDLALILAATEEFKSLPRNAQMAMVQKNKFLGSAFKAASSDIHTEKRVAEEKKANDPKRKAEKIIREQKQADKKRKEVAEAAEVEAAKIAQYFEIKGQLNDFYFDKLRAADINAKVDEEPVNLASADPVAEFKFKFNTLKMQHLNGSYFKLKCEFQQMVRAVEYHHYCTKHLKMSNEKFAQKLMQETELNWDTQKRFRSLIPMVEMYPRLLFVPIPLYQLYALKTTFEKCIAKYHHESWWAMDVLLVDGPLEWTFGGIAQSISPGKPAPKISIEAQFQDTVRQYESSAANLDASSKSMLTNFAGLTLDQEKPLSTMPTDDSGSDEGYATPNE